MSIDCCTMVADPYVSIVHAWFGGSAMVQDSANGRIHSHLVIKVKRGSAIAFVLYNFEADLFK